MNRIKLYQTIYHVYIIHGDKLIKAIKSTNLPLGIRDDLTFLFCISTLNT